MSFAIASPNVKKHHTDQNGADSLCWAAASFFIYKNTVWGLYKKGYVETEAMDEGIANGLSFSVLAVKPMLHILFLHKIHHLQRRNTSYEI